MNKIYVKNDELVIKVPFSQRQYCPITEKYLGRMDNIIGLIKHTKTCNTPDMGFCYRIDMSYKGKDDQWTDYFYQYFGVSVKSFKKLCDKLNIGWVEN